MTHTTSSLDQQLDLFHGPATDSAATFYARWNVDNHRGRFRLCGTITGPYCKYAQTLPASYPCSDQGPGPTALARATLLDACAWSPDLPATYQVTLEFWDGEHSLGCLERITAIRRFGPVGRSFSLNGKRTVLRIGQIATTVQPLAAWRAARLTRLVDLAEATDGLCQEASELGVPLIVEVPSRAGPLRDHLRQIARWPAVVAALLPAELMDAGLRRGAPTFYSACGWKMGRQLPRSGSRRAVRILPLPAQRFAVGSRASNRSR